MKLIRWGEPGLESPGLVNQAGQYVDASAWGEDYTETFFARDGLQRLAGWAESHLDTLPVLPPGVRLGPPVARPSKLICIGLNYADHARESGAKIPAEPIVFMKATSAICGPYDTVIIPPGSEKLDWEVELAVVIGRQTRYVSEADADHYIAGYVLHNDLSERAWQLERGGQWVKGKSGDTFAPLGPFLTTADEIPDPQSLDLWLSVNGVRCQNSNTREMIFPVRYLVSYLSQFMTLLPGDIISTGTPHGVGMGMNPPQYLKPGDVMELGVAGLGISRQPAIAYAPDFGSIA
ncbi:MAG: fumarylacetoacetate hydrolase family protein [Bacteroidia bacterium]|nr:fumarylacetoacetate hydrolase family protein [Bacteroidia bacterium]